MKILGKSIIKVSRFLAYGSSAAIIFIMILVTSDVLKRFILRKPIIGTTELTELLLVPAVFLAFAWCAICGRHVKVDIVTSRFSRRTQAYIDIITSSIALVILAIITWQNIVEALEVEGTSSLLEIPDAPFYWCLCAGLVVFCFSIMVVLREKIREIRKK
jgi:TRAP-type C4-dicarboxylate transport system permease small subunit